MSGIPGDDLTITDFREILFLCAILDRAVAFEIIVLHQLDVDALVDDPVVPLAIFRCVRETNEIEIYLKENELQNCQLSMIHEFLLHLVIQFKLRDEKLVGCWAHFV
jgi:hypothetical protein